jgi:hypothetical protein
LEAASAPQADKYLDRVIKYIPSEIVGAWIALTGIIASAAAGPTTVVLWVVFAIGVILTPIYIWRQTSEPGKKAAITQIVISACAFIVWVFALGGPFAGLGFYQPWLGSVVLIVFTLIVGAVIPPES